MFRGSIPALVTPFRDGVVDEKAFENLVERQIEAGAGALVPVGTTGETSTLTHEEHRKVVTICVSIARGRVPVIAGAGSNATAEAISLVEHAKTVGADAALVVCPYYNKPNQAGLEAHFTAINDAVALPVFIYNVPSRTVVDIHAETVAALARLPNIIGIKDATGDMGRMQRHLELVEDQSFVFLSGDDPTAVEFCQSGGAGCISVTANVAARQTAALHELIERNEISEAKSIDDRLSSLHRALFMSPSPGPAKYALERLGLCSSELRLPLSPPDEDTRKAIDKAMTEAGVES